MYADLTSQLIMNSNTSLLAPVSTDWLSAMIIKTLSLGKLHLMKPRKEILLELLF
jgi:hypothetical protein